VEDHYASIHISGCYICKNKSYMATSTPINLGKVWYPKGREVVLDITYQIGSFLDPRGLAIQVGRALKSHDIPY